MTVPQLTQHALRVMRERADVLGLSRENVSATYILNWGGFQAASFRIDDGENRLHLKLVPDSDWPDVARWLSMHELLTARYHAPRVIEELALSEINYRGVVFENIEAGVLETQTSPDVVDAVCNVAARLHADVELTNRIDRHRAPANLRDAYYQRFRAQLEEDIKLISTQLPPFVTASTWRWIQDESQKVLLIPQNNAAFDGEGISLCHGDLWANNILVYPDGPFWIIDWDALGFADPVVDYATLALSAFLDNGRTWRSLPIESSLAPRMEHYLRTMLLHWSIDVLADWLDCDVSPEHRDHVRSEKQMQHAKHLQLYRDTYADVSC